MSRQARCVYCGTKVDSSNPGSIGYKTLPFFEDRGKGSEKAKKTCKHCKYYDVAHTPEKQANNPRICKNFESHGEFEFDLFYCGCRGWD